MSNFEKHEGNTGQEVRAIGPDTLTTEDVTRLLGASVVILASSPLEALQMYHQRQVEIRNQLQNEDEA